MRFPSSYLPTQATCTTSNSRTARGWTIDAAQLSPTDLQAEVDAAAAAARTLRWRPVASILTSLRRVADQWLAADSADFATAVEVLHDITGYSSAVLQRGLRAHFTAVAGDAIGALLDRELGDRLRLDRDLRTRNFASITHYLAGNLPGLTIAPMMLSLALRSAPLIKCAQGDPYLPAALARSIGGLDPELGRCVVVHDWRGGMDPCDGVVSYSPLVVIMGADETIRFIASRMRGERCLAHGTKVSFAVVTREAFADNGQAQHVARALALDVAQWDQFGCLSPQLAFVEGDADDLERFAAVVAAALAEVTIELPPRRVALHDNTAIGLFRQRCEWEPTSPHDRIVVAPDSTDWTLSLEHAPQFRAGSPHRCLRLLRLDDLASLTPLLAAHTHLLECAGVAAGPAREPGLRAQLEGAGVHRVCALGEMQTPTLAWRQSGRPRIADWLRLDAAPRSRKSR